MFYFNLISGIENVFIYFFLVNNNVCCQDVTLRIIFNSARQRTCSLLIHVFTVVPFFLSLGCQLSKYLLVNIPLFISFFNFILRFHTCADFLSVHFPFSFPLSSYFPFGSNTIELYGHIQKRDWQMGSQYKVSSFLSVSLSLSLVE